MKKLILLLILGFAVGNNAIYGKNNSIKTEPASTHPGTAFNLALAWSNTKPNNIVTCKYYNNEFNLYATQQKVLSGSFTDLGNGQGYYLFKVEGFVSGRYNAYSGVCSAWTTQTVKVSLGNGNYSNTSIAASSKWPTITFASNSYNDSDNTVLNRDQNSGIVSELLNRDVNNFNYNPKKVQYWTISYKGESYNVHDTHVDKIISHTGPIYQVSASGKIEDDVVSKEVALNNQILNVDILTGEVYCVRNWSVAPIIHPFPNWTPAFEDSFITGITSAISYASAHDKGILYQGTYHQVDQLGCLKWSVDPDGGYDYAITGIWGKEEKSTFKYDYSTAEMFVRVNNNQISSDSVWYNM